MKKKRTFYVTTPIYYSSGSPHLGHAYTTIACDVIKKWNELLGVHSFFTTGNDDHGQKIVEEAIKAKKDILKFVDEKAAEFKHLMEEMGSSFDYYVRTTNKDHKKFVQKMLQKAFDAGDIYKGVYEGLYCVGCEKYYTEKDAVEGKCPIHKRKLNMINEESYFFKLSKYQKKLLDFYKKNPEFLSPKFRASEMLNRVKDGLKDVSISRNKESLSWGIELPFDKNHVTYVWFDALFNYLSSCYITKREKFWPADIHMVGYDISWFHTVYWPAFLMSVGYDLPKKVFSHGMILDKDGHKMSKSLGNVIDPFEMKEKYGLDELRYCLLASGSFGEDLNLSEELFVEKINNELNNDLGNLVSRVHAMVGKYFNGVVPESDYKLSEFFDKKSTTDFLIEKLDIFDEFDKKMQNLEFNHALDLLWEAIREVNAYINKVEPWKIEDERRLGTVMNVLCSSIRLISCYLRCFMPLVAERIDEQYNFKSDFRFENLDFRFENLKKGHKLGEKDNLFNKVKFEEKKDSRKCGKIRAVVFDFSSLNLRIGKIIEIDRHPEADKLYVEKIDVGEEKPRQIVSGLRDFYDRNEMLNKKVVVVTNLKPAKLRGVKSEGMILAADNNKGGVGLVTSDAKVGENLTCDNLVANNDKRIDVDAFFKIKMKSDGKTIYHQENEILAGKTKLSVDKKVVGKVR